MKANAKNYWFHISCYQDTTRSHIFYIKKKKIPNSTTYLNENVIKYHIRYTYRTQTFTSKFNGPCMQDMCSAVYVVDFLAVCLFIHRCFTSQVIVVCIWYNVFIKPHFACIERSGQYVTGKQLFRTNTLLDCGQIYIFIPHFNRSHCNKYTRPSNHTQNIYEHKFNVCLTIYIKRWYIPLSHTKSVCFMVSSVSDYKYYKLNQENIVELLFTNNTTLCVLIKHTHNF